MSAVRPVCLPTYQCNRNVTQMNSGSEISSLTTRVESLCSQNKADFEALQTQFETLKSTLANFETLASNVGQSHQAPPPEPISIPSDHVLSVTHSHPPVSLYVEEFLPADECSELSNFLKTLQPYKKEKGRSTIKFGEKYHFNGSREDSIVDFPPLIKRVLDNLNEH